MANKKYRVSISFEVIEIDVTAENKTAAKKKALIKLARKNPVKLIQSHYPTDKKEVYVDEL